MKEQLTEDQWLKRGYYLIAYYHDKKDAERRKRTEELKGKKVIIDDAWDGYYTIYEKR